jgi:hypothetical protein
MGSMSIFAILLFCMVFNANSYKSEYSVYRIHIATLNIKLIINPTLLKSETNCVIDFTFKSINSQALWFMPVNLATQEAEIRRIMVRSQVGQNSLWDPGKNSSHTHKKGWWSGSRYRAWFQTLVPQKKKKKKVCKQWI